MRYYQVTVSSEPNVIGVKNGIFQIDIDKDRLRKKVEFKNFLEFFNYNNKEFWKNQDFIPNLKVPVIDAKLLKKARLTDIMGYTQNITFLDNVYSSKYVDILKEFHIGKYTTFEVEIESIDKKYYMIYFQTIILEHINYENSIIYTGHNIMNNVKHYTIKNYNEYIEFKQENPLHTFEKMCIPKEYFGRDLIPIQRAVHNFYSERLIDKLLKENISGLEIKYNNSIQLEFR